MVNPSTHEIFRVEFSDGGLYGHLRIIVRGSQIVFEICDWEGAKYAVLNATDLQRLPETLLEWRAENGDIAARGVHRGTF